MHPQNILLFVMLRRFRLIFVKEFESKSLCSNFLSWTKEDQCEVFLRRSVWKLETSVNSVESCCLEATETWRRSCVFSFSRDQNEFMTFSDLRSAPDLRSSGSVVPIILVSALPLCSASAELWVPEIWHLHKRPASDKAHCVWGVGLSSLIAHA